MHWRNLIFAGILALAPAAMAMEPSSPSMSQRPTDTTKPGTNLPHAPNSPVPIRSFGSGTGGSGSSTLGGTRVATGVVSGPFVSVQRKVVRLDVDGHPVTLNAQGLDFQSQLHDGDQLRATYAVKNGQWLATQIWRVTPNGNELVAAPPQSPPPGMVPQ